MAINILIIIGIVISAFICLMAATTTIFKFENRDKIILTTLIIMFILTFIAFLMRL